MLRKKLFCVRNSHFLDMMDIFFQKGLWHHWQYAVATVFLLNEATWLVSVSFNIKLKSWEEVFAKTLLPTQGDPTDII